MTQKNDGRSYNELVIKCYEGPSPVDDILKEQLQPTLDLFRSKARDYSERSGVFTADLLGAQGQFAEIWRKIPKLKKGMWDQEPLENESVREILQDIIGHCLLALDFDAKAQPPKPAGEMWAFESGGIRNAVCDGRGCAEGCQVHG